MRAFGQVAWSIPLPGMNDEFNRADDGGLSPSIARRTAGVLGTGETRLTTSRAPCRPDAALVSPGGGFWEPDGAFFPPDAASGGPDAALVEPGATFEEPEVTFEEPDASCGWPDAAFFPPDAAFEEPAVAFEEPGASSGPPDAAFFPPDATFEEPDAAFCRQNKTPKGPTSPPSAPPFPAARSVIGAIRHGSGGRAGEALRGNYSGLASCGLLKTLRSLSEGGTGPSAILGAPAATTGLSGSASVRAIVSTGITKPR